MAPNATFLGLEIGGTKLHLVTGSAAGEIHARRRFEVARAEGAAGIRQQIASALPELLATAQVAGVGVGFGGPVDWRTGRICVSHHVTGWSEFDLAGWLRERTGASVTVDNDANVAALGEARCGAGVGCEPVFYVTLGSGVGGGLVTDAGRYHGAAPGEAELGHVRLDRSGATVESRCSGWSVDARIRQLQETAPTSLLAKLASAAPGREARHLAPALASGDPTAAQLLRDVAGDLAFGLSHVVHLFHPQVIVLGGGLSLVGEPLRAAVADALPRFLMDAFQPGPRLALSALGEDAVPVGALLLAAQGNEE
jgi:glucokinase